MTMNFNHFAVERSTHCLHSDRPLNRLEERMCLEVAGRSLTEWRVNGRIVEVVIAPVGDECVRRVEAERVLECEHLDAREERAMRGPSPSMNAALPVVAGGSSPFTP